MNIVDKYKFNFNMYFSIVKEICLALSYGNSINNSNRFFIEPQYDVAFLSLFDQLRNKSKHKEVTLKHLLTTDICFQNPHNGDIAKIRLDIKHLDKTVIKSIKFAIEKCKDSNYELDAGLCFSRFLNAFLKLKENADTADFLVLYDNREYDERNNPPRESWKKSTVRNDPRYR